VEKLQQYLVLSPTELEFLRDLHQVRRRVDRHREIIIAGRRYDHIFILCSGIVCPDTRYSRMESVRS
jgi:hypothetical protein